MLLRLIKLGRTLLPLVAVAGCSAQTAVKGATKHADKEDTAATDAADAGDVDSSGGDDSGVPDDNGGGASLDDIIKQCGVDSATLANPTAVLLDQQMVSWPKVYVGVSPQPIVGNVNYKVTVKVKLNIHATVGEMRQTTDFDVTAEPAQALGQAKQQTDPQKGYTLAKNLSVQDRVTLMGEQADWNSIVCTVQPVREMEVSKGGHIRRIKFDPPLPASVSPKADPARYAAEIGQGRTFKNITATVTFSTDPAVPVGTKLTGEVDVTQTSPSLTLNIGGKSTQTVTADAAYRMEFKFGASVADTLKVGLMPMETLFIDYAKHGIKIVVADTGSEDTGTVVMSEDQ